MEEKYDINDPEGIIGNTYNRLTVVSYSHNKKGHKFYFCKCICGNICNVSNHALKSGNTKSCGCYIKEIRKTACVTHGLSKTPEYKIWCDIKKRCYNQKNKSYKYYGERGIKMSNDWLKSFPNFLRDVGKRPTTLHTIDRIDVNRNYEIGNCRWITMYEQNQNRRDNWKIEINGELRTITEWARIYNIERKTVTHRILKLGMTPIEAFTHKPDSNQTRRIKNNNNGTENS